MWDEQQERIQSGGHRCEGCGAFLPHPDSELCPACGLTPSPEEGFPESLFFVLFGSVAMIVILIVGFTMPNSLGLIAILTALTVAFLSRDKDFFFGNREAKPKAPPPVSMGSLKSVQSADPVSSILDESRNALRQIEKKRDSIRDILRELDPVTGRAQIQLAEEAMVVLDRQSLRYARVQCQSEVQLLAQDLRKLQRREEAASEDYIERAALKAPASRGVENAIELVEHIEARSQLERFFTEDILAKLGRIQAGFYALQQRALKASLLHHTEGLSGIELDPQVGLDAHNQSTDPDAIWSLPELELASDELRFEIQSEYQRLKSESQIDDEFPLGD